MKRRIGKLTWAAAALLLCGAATAATEAWPHWRGPQNNGVGEAEGLPAAWGADQRVAWRLELPGPAPSTPVVWQDRIFLTTASGEDLALMCVSASGRELWRRTLSGGAKDIRQGESNPAAPSPSTDGKHVWAFTGTGALACFTVDGEQVWKTDIQQRYNPFSMYFGMSSSPLLDGDRLYLSLLHAKAQTVVALDKATGEEIWKRERPSQAKKESLHSYASPVIYRDGQHEYLLIHGSDVISAHDLASGAEIWRCGGLQKESYNPFYRFVATPAAVDGLIVAPSAKNGPVLGLKPGGKGDITGDQARYAWKFPDNTPDVPSPLIHGGLVYLCRENGVLLCLDAKTGELVYKNRTHDGRHRGSPVLADGKLYLTALDGTVSVIQAGREFKILAQNSFGEPQAASPVIANNTIYLRTHKALYAVRQ